MASSYAYRNVSCCHVGTSNGFFSMAKQQRRDDIYCQSICSSRFTNCIYIIERWWSLTMGVDSVDSLWCCYLCFTTTFFMAVIFYYIAKEQ